ncbi:MAG: hypothetical protein AAGA87_12515 [Pseudomonadota bacterium]
MSLTQKDIRAVEAETLVLRRQLKSLRKAALADDGIIDKKEQAEIDKIEANIDTIRSSLNKKLLELSDDEISKMKLTQPDSDEVYSEEYMSDLRDTSFEGGDPPKSYEGNNDLKDVMRDIQTGTLTGAKREEAMQKLEAIMGVPPSAGELDADYGRFLVLQKQQNAIGGKKADDLNEESHPDFMGSRSQLIFGKIMGDSFGINEIFGAMLSPTGGLVGPGNTSIQLPPDDPVALHGTVHDAAGYMDSFHDEGPGYNYREDEIESVVVSVLKAVPGLDVLLPGTGQVSGIAWWMEETETDRGEYLEEKFDQVVALADEKLDEARDAVAEKISDGIDVVKDKANEVIQQAESLMDTVGDVAQDFQDTISSGIETAGEALSDFGSDALEVGEAVVDGVGRAMESASEAYDTVSEGVGNIAEAAGEKLDALADFIWG